jgi:hypothetical protein
VKQINIIYTNETSNTSLQAIVNTHTSELATKKGLSNGLCQLNSNSVIANEFIPPLGITKPTVYTARDLDVLF